MSCGVGESGMGVWNDMYNSESIHFLHYFAMLEVPVLVIKNILSNTFQVLLKNERKHLLPCARLGYTSCIT